MMISISRLECRYFIRCQWYIGLDTLILVNYGITPVKCTSNIPVLNYPIVVIVKLAHILAPSLNIYGNGKFEGC